MRFNKGDILVPKGKEYPECAIVVDGYDDKGQLIMHPLGGGIEAHLSAIGASVFRLVDEGEKAGALFHRGQFALAESEERFSGWTDGKKWNGWEMPRFEKAEAERLIQWLSGERGRFDEERDAFVTGTQGDEDEVWASEQIVISDGSVLKVYPIGAGAWIWDTI